MKKLKLEYFAHARGNNFTDPCNGETSLNLECSEHFNQLLFKTTLLFKGDTGLIRLVALRLADMIPKIIMYKT